MYASFLEISGALDLDVFGRPSSNDFVDNADNLLGLRAEKGREGSDFLVRC
jgi:hypothetical protein